MKKSLLVTFDFPPKHGGVSTCLAQYVSQLPLGTAGVLTEPAAPPLATNYPVHRERFLSSLGLIWPRWLPMFLAIRRLVRREGYQILQAGQIVPVGTAALLLNLFTGLPYIVYVYGLDLLLVKNSRRKRWLAKKILGRAHGVVAPSAYTKELAVSLGAAAERTYVVHPIPEQARLVTADAVAAFEEKYGIQGKKVLLTVGNLVKRKGHDMVIQALPRVQAEVGAVRYLVVGTGREQERLAALSERHGVRDAVLFVGQLDDNELPLAYAAADVFIMPSRILRDSAGQACDVEGFGVVYLEASQYGLPVIAGNSGGVPDAVADGISGILVDPESVDSISDAILKILKDGSLAETLGHQGKVRAEGQFLLDTEIEKVKALLS